MKRTVYCDFCDATEEAEVVGPSMALNTFEFVLIPNEILIVCPKCAAETREESSTNE